MGTHFIGDEEVRKLAFYDILGSIRKALITQLLISCARYKLHSERLRTLGDDPKKSLTSWTIGWSGRGGLGGKGVEDK